MTAIAWSIVASLIANELCDVSPWCATKLVRWSARLGYADPGRAEIRAEELAAMIGDRPGNLLKLAMAIRFVTAALGHACVSGIRHRLSRRPRTNAAESATQDQPDFLWMPAAGQGGPSQFAIPWADAWRLVDADGNLVPMPPRRLPTPRGATWREVYAGPWNSDPID